MLSIVTLDCQVTKIVMNSGYNLRFKGHKFLGLSKFSEIVKVVKNCQSCQKLSLLSKIVKVVKNSQSCPKLLKLSEMVKHIWLQIYRFNFLHSLKNAIAHITLCTEYFFQKSFAFKAEVKKEELDEFLSLAGALIIFNID